MLYLRMFEERYQEKVPRSGIIIPSDLPYLRRLYTFNKDRIIDYYRDRNFFVKNTFILSRLLEHFPVYLGYDTYRYLETVNDKTKYLTKHFKFTSEIEKGIVHPPYFFGNEGDELILANYETFDIRRAQIDWKNSSPISVFCHPRNDLKLLIPFGKDDGSRSGLSVLNINIPMLTIKYREFMKEQAMISETGEGSPINKNVFMTKYVLPNMLPDIIDHVFLNKVMDRFYGRETIVPQYKHRFKLFEPTTQINRYLDQTVERLKHKKGDYVNLLRSIKLMFREDASELLSFSFEDVVRTNSWAIILGRIDYMIFLYDVCSDNGFNKHYINDWKRLVTRVERDNLFSTVLDETEMRVLQEKFDKIKQM